MEDYLKPALTMYKALYRGNHSSIASLFNDIGAVYQSLGKYQEALKFHEQALEMYHNLYPDNLDHTDIHKVIQNIAKLKQ